MTMHRLFSHSALVFAIISVTPAVALAAFSDVPSEHANFEAISSLQEAKIISGYGDNIFKPDQNVSRAEAVAIILKAAGVQLDVAPKKTSFSDVPEGAWFFPAIAKGVQLGKIKGYEDKTFRPDSPVTLPEALAFLISFFKVSTNRIELDAVIYEGLKKNDWYGQRAQYAKNKNLIEPSADGRVDPVAPMTRAALAELVYRMREVVKSGSAYDITKKWVTTSHPENFWHIKHPQEWELFKGLKNSVLWKRAPGQVFFTRLWPGSARLSISLVEGVTEPTAALYFKARRSEYEAQYKNSKPAFSEILLNGKRALKVVIAKERLIEFTIELPHKKFLVLSGEYGSAAIGVWNEKQLSTAMASYKFIEKPAEAPKPVTPLSERMVELREKILVSGAWKTASALFPDKKLIHTDAIGIGTGPVDYFFSKEANHTFKIERGSMTILNIRETETSAF